MKKGNSHFIIILMSPVIFSCILHHLIFRWKVHGSPLVEQRQPPKGQFKWSFYLMIHVKLVPFTLRNTPKNSIWNGFWRSRSMRGEKIRFEFREWKIHSVWVIGLVNVGCEYRNKNMCQNLLTMSAPCFRPTFSPLRSPVTSYWAHRPNSLRSVQWMGRSRELPLVPAIATTILFILLSPIVDWFGDIGV